MGGIDQKIRALGVVSVLGGILKVRFSNSVAETYKYVYDLGFSRTRKMYIYFVLGLLWQSKKEWREDFQWIIPELLEMVSRFASKKPSYKREEFAKLLFSL